MHPAAQESLERIPAQNRGSWSALDLVDLEKKHRSTRADGATGRFWVVFVNGYFERDGRVRHSVLGVSIAGTSVVAMFGPVLRTPGALQSDLEGRFAEQTTIVHELGHALGLVNNGLPLRSLHHDTANGAHCLNTACIMYWKNEASESLVQFIEGYEKTGSTVLFGQECLDDARQF